MFQEEYLADKRKKYFLIGGVSIFALILIFVVLRLFVFKQQPPSPPLVVLTPEEVVTNYFSLEFNRNRSESEKYLFSDFSKVEILGENYLNVRTSLQTQAPKKAGLKPEYKIVNQEVQDNEARISLETSTNEMGGSLFLSFYLPEKLLFNVSLIKEGVDWKILRVDSPDLILTNKLGEKVEIIKGVFIQPIKIIDYKDKKPANSLNKFLRLEVEFENKTSGAATFSSPMEWRVLNQDKQFYYPIINIDWQTIGQNQEQPPTPLTEPEISFLPDIKLNPDETKKASIFFELPKEFLVKELVFQNLDKKIIFEIY